MVQEGRDIFRVEHCTRCPQLVECRHNIINGSGKPSASILIIGQSPDEVAEQNNQPFMGRQGKLLQILMDLAGIPRSMTWRTQAVRCHTPDNRRPTDIELANCRPHLLEEIRSLQPKVIIALGEPALTVLYGMDGDAMLQYDADEKAFDLEFKQWQGALVAWEAARKALEGKRPKHEDGTWWLKPKRPKKPIKPKTQKKALKEISGHTLIQPDTGILMVPTFHPQYLMYGHWAECALVVQHFKKALRIARGEEVFEDLPNYATLKTVDDVAALRDYLLSDLAEMIYFDTETTGLEWKSAELLCISLAGQEGEGYVVPILHNNNGQLEWFWSTEDLAQVIAILKQIFGSDKPKCGHNMPFDMRLLERDAKDIWISAATAFGIHVAYPHIDTEIGHAVIAEGLPHNMTNVLAVHTTMPYYEDEIYRLSEGKKKMAKVKNGKLWQYSAADADGLPRMRKSIIKIAVEEGSDWLLINVVYPMIRVCRNMEDHGIPIDLDYFERLCEYYRIKKNEKERELYEGYPELDRFRWWVPADLQDVLFVKLKLPKSGRMTKAAKTCPVCKDPNEKCDKHDATGAAALADIYKLTKHPILLPIMELKKLDKMQSTYLDGGNGGWAKHIRPDGRIHPSYKISKVETGRLASSDPNVQNPPKGIHIHPYGPCKEGCPVKGPDLIAQRLNIDTQNAFRDIIRAQPGFGIMSVDWNQLEVWVLAYELAERFHDSTLLDILLGGRDVHTVMGRMLWPEVDPDMSEAQWRVIHKDLRDKAKTFVFGLAYGLTIFGIVQRTGLSEEEAKSLLNRFFELVPGLQKYFKYIHDSLLYKGFIMNRFLRRRHGMHAAIMKAMGADFDLEAYNREGVNMPIQSGGSDLHSVVSAITDAWQPLKDRQCYAIQSMHDSLAFEFYWPDDDYALQTAWMIKNLWETTARNLICPDGKPLNWQTLVECDWGLTLGTPTHHLSATGVMKGPEPNAHV